MTRRDEPDIARLYHLHSANVRRRLPDLTVDHDRHPLRFRTYPGAQRLDLPGRDFNLTAPLGEALGERRSVRAFELQPLPLDLLGRLLHASYGLRRPGQLIGQGVAERPAPSAGGLYPLEIYVATHLVVDLPDAIYHYDPRSHALELRRPGLAQHQLAEMTIGQDMLLQANVVCIITAVFQRTMWKYGPRGYRYVWLDAGHVGQNLYLVTEALGLGSVAIGGFYDAEVNALLDLPADEEAIYLFGIGRTAVPHQEGGGS